MEYKQSLKFFTEKIEEGSKTCIGYPASVDYDYTELYPLLKFTMNNVGDPMFESSYTMHSKNFERDVISFFGELFNAPPENRWGYVTNGGSEGNLYALYLARELYPNGMVYYSEATHYSVQKNIHLLNMSSIVIRADGAGEMDYEDLAETMQQHRHKPVIVLANIGTTMTEAKDDVGSIKAILKQYAIKNSYIHCDAALAGTYLALMGEQGTFDFIQGADSIAISGHKFIGSPIPCGVVIVKKSYKDRVGKAIPYIGNLDTTISGSRNAITPVFLWYALNKIGSEGLKIRAMAAMELAAFLTEELQKIGIPAWRNKRALTVVFPRPSEKICKKWQLATEGDIAHVICMPGVGKEKLELFLYDMKKLECAF